MTVVINRTIKVNPQQMEEIEGLTTEYPYTLHRVNLENTTIPWHWHEELEFAYVIEGKKAVSTTTRDYEFHEGEAFFTNTNVLCTMKNIRKCKIDSHLFHSTFLSGHFRSIFETKYMNPILQNKKIELIEIRGTTSAQQKILSKLRQVSALQEKEDQEFQTRNLFSEIWLLLLEEIANMPDPATTISSVSKERLMTMMTYIQKNYAYKITLEEIAASASISSREALRCFQTTIRETPFEYLMGYRIEIAKKLLKATNLSVTEISLQTGFSNSAYFSKIFKRSCRMTPLAYRKEMQEIQHESSI